MRKLSESRKEANVESLQSDLRGRKILQDLYMEDWQFWSSARKENTVGHLMCMLFRREFLLFYCGFF